MRSEPSSVKLYMLDSSTPSILPAVQIFYGGESLTYYADALLQQNNQRGPKQGCVLGTTTFALATHQLWTALEKSFKTLTGRALTDDWNMTTRQPRPIITRAVARLLQEHQQVLQPPPGQRR